MQNNGPRKTSDDIIDIYLVNANGNANILE